MLNPKKIGTAIIIAVLLIFPALSQNYAYIITDLDFQGTLNKNNVMSVTETISVNFYQDRHGIFRQIPAYFEVKRDVDGKPKLMRYQTAVKNVQVKDDNAAVSSDSDYYVIKIGNADVTFTGPHTYTIKYDYVMPDDRISENDFFFYSPLGAEWDVPVSNFSFKITLQEPFPADTDLKIYSGAIGSSSNSLNVQYSFDGKSISGSAASIKPGNAVTVFANLPEGYFINAKKTSTFFPWLFAIASVVTTLFVIIQMFAGNRKKPVQTVEFYPPEGITSADVGFIIDHSAEDSDVLSLIIQFADKGYLSIEEVTGKNGKVDYLSLTKLKDMESDADYCSKTLFDSLFEKGSRRDLKDLDENFTNGLDASKSLLRDKFAGKKKLYKGTGKAVGFIMLASLMNGLFIATSSSVSTFANIPFGIFSTITMIMFGCIRYSTIYTKNFKKGARIIPALIVSAIFFAFTAITVLIAGSNSILPAPVLYGVPALTAVTLFFSNRLAQMTDYNVEITGKLLGLKEFIKVAELPKLKMLVDENPSYYYNILPYAMVFGLTDKWAKQFKSISVQKPDWYRQTSVTPYDVFYFNRMMHSNVNSPVSSVRAAQAAARAAAHSAASGSSSGGGFSGGGGGGGGGGSW